jgi:cytochrome c biogenesis protein CcmG/thiol:disulfide interchange protein DsbE
VSSVSNTAVPPRPMSRRAILGTAALGLAGASLAGVYGWNRFDLRSRLFNPFSQTNFDLEPVPGVKLASGAQAPGFSADDLMGQVTVLNFWASWCPPCIGEHPFVSAMSRDKRFRVFGANYKDSPDGAARFLAEHGNPYAAVGDDRQGFVSRAFGARGAPWTFVLDREARVAFTLPGPMDSENVAGVLLPAIEKLL